MSEVPSDTTELVQVLQHVDDYLRLGQEYECSDVHLATASKVWGIYIGEVIRRFPGG